MQKTLFRALIGSSAAAIEAVRQYQGGAGMNEVGQAAAVAALVAVALVWGAGTLVRKGLTD